jgi:transposase
MDAAVLREENERLKTLLVETQAALAEAEEARHRLEIIIGQLNREKFGAKSEKLRPDQYHLPLEDVEVAQGILDAAQEKAAAVIKGKPDGAARTSNRNRGQLPAHLPRVERIIEPRSTLCPCGCGEMAKIGEDVSERLDAIPAQLRVLVTRRPKYACRRCSAAVVQASAPEHVVPGGLPTEALIAQIIVAKFGDHLPFYRQAEIYARQGIQLDRATLPITCGLTWLGRIACSWMKLQRRCSIRGVGGPGRASSGRLPAMIADLVALVRRSCCSDMHPDGAANMPSASCMASAVASCSAMATTGTIGSNVSSDHRDRGCWCIAGAICAVAS